MREAGSSKAASMRLNSHPMFARIVKELGLRQRDTSLLRDCVQPIMQKILDAVSEEQKEAKQELADARLRAVYDKIEDKAPYDDCVARLISLCHDVAAHTKEAGEMETGIGFKRDTELGTDKHVFSVIGANNCDGYGDYVLVLQPRIMQHPDFNMTLTAATSYLSKRTYFHRPWVALGQVVNYVPTDMGMHCDDVSLAPGNVASTNADEVLDTVKVMRDGEEAPLTNEEMLKFFHRGKLHPSAVDWETLVAMDLALQARLFLMSKRNLDTWVDRHSMTWREEFKEKALGGRQPGVEDIDLETVKTWYTKINAHGCIEGHLPEFVPLEYIEHILMPKDERYAGLIEELSKIVMADGEPLSSRVVGIAPGGHYSTRLREWQVNHFTQRALTEFSKVGLHNAIDMRAFCFGLESQQAAEVFLPLRILNPQKGFTLKFRVKGQHIRITLTDKREPTRNESDRQVYLLAIGCFKNQKSFLKRNNKSGQPSLLEVAREEDPFAMAFPDRYREYWITYDARSGQLRLGCDRAILMEHTDPDPHQAIQYVAVSCWDTPVDFAMMKYSVLESSPLLDGS
eukprot:TRINITY_DN20139_c0_g1_i6.p1 TRINITY_DN20139_c0_g1~~TRINITY_DN20139_c0_g1_i6.p1  ORF type:complete len:570 (-),score=94.83 TRINITY_DN20139_c0_g1_i6:430-2139(-)